MNAYSKLGGVGLVLLCLVHELVLCAGADQATMAVLFAPSADAPTSGYLAVAFLISLRLTLFFGPALVLPWLGLRLAGRYFELRRAGSNRGAPRTPTLRAPSSDPA